MGVTYDKILDEALLHNHTLDDIIGLATIFGNFYGTWDASGGLYPVPPGAGYWIISVAGTLGGTALKPGDYLVWDGAGWTYVIMPFMNFVSLTANLVVGNNTVAHGLATTPRLVQCWYNDEKVDFSYSRTPGNIIIYSTTNLNNVEINIFGS